MAHLYRQLTTKRLNIPPTIAISDSANITICQRASLLGAVFFLHRLLEGLALVDIL